MAEQRKRAPSVEATKFIKAWNSGRRAGKSKDEIAEELGMTPLSAYQRYLAINRRFEAEGRDIRLIAPDGSTRRLDIDELEAAAMEGADEE